MLVGFAVIGAVTGIVVALIIGSQFLQKEPIVRVVCRADGHERCPTADAFVECGDPESAEKLKGA
jgi:hypothetical protein